jgi:hypothetical protein
MSIDHLHTGTTGLVLSALVYASLFIIPLLAGIAFNKKKFLLYADQIRDCGRISDRLGYSIIFDVKLPTYIFKGISLSELPQRSSQSFEAMTRLTEKIKTLTLISQQIAIAFGVGTITLIILRS